ATMRSVVGRTPMVFMKGLSIIPRMNRPMQKLIGPRWQNLSNKTAHDIRADLKGPNQFIWRDHDQKIARPDGGVLLSLNKLVADAGQRTGEGPRPGSCRGTAWRSWSNHVAGWIGKGRSAGAMLEVSCVGAHCQRGRQFAAGMDRSVRHDGETSRRPA